MALTIRQEVIRNPEGKIKFWVPPVGGREHYHLGVWVDGDAEELDLIQRVEYLLHPTFRQPLRRSSNRANKFSVTFWTWGMFLITVTVFLQDGSALKLEHYLSYDLPEDAGDAYLQVTTT